MGLARGRGVSALPDFGSRAARRGTAVSAERVWLLVGAGLLLLALAASWSARSRLELVRAAAADAGAAARDARARVAAARASQDPAAQALAERARLSTTAAPPRVLRELQELMPGAVRLEHVALSYGDQLELELRVAARSALDYDALLERLSRAQTFLLSSTGPENREGEVHALIRLRWAPEAP